MTVGLEKIKLSKTWNAHKKGSTVEVDPVRAKWLRDNGYDVAHPKAKPAPLRLVEEGNAE